MRPQASSRPCPLARQRELTTVEKTAMTEEAEVRPLQPIRRFDVFAETKRLEALAHVEPGDVAKGYETTIAKIVASSGLGGSKTKKTRHEKDDTAEGEPLTGSRFGGEG